MNLNESFEMYWGVNVTELNLNCDAACTKLAGTNWHLAGFVQFNLPL